MTPGQTITEQLTEFITATFPLARKRRLAPHDHLLESGIVDSLGVLNLVGFVERQFQVAVTDDDLVPENFQSIDHLTAFVRRKRGEGAGAHHAVDGA
jgi:acyl carrier protein